MTVTRVALILVAGFAIGAPVHAQEQPAAAAQKQEAMPLPTPGPEHEIFKEDAGTWDATVETFMAPGAPPMVSKGVEVNTVGCSGLCLVTDFKGEAMPGVAFHGHGVATYDAAKKKYVGSWTDSMSSGLAVGESTWDARTRTMTGWMEGPDMTGKVAKMKSVVEYKDRDSRVFTMYTPGPDGKEAVGMRITYQRSQAHH
jgi:hypothetical protein